MNEYSFDTRDIFAVWNLSLIRSGLDKTKQKTERLKGTAARWIQPKLGSFDRFLLQRVALRFLEKSASPPSYESPLKILRHLACTVIGY